MWKQRSTDTYTPPETVSGVIGAPEPERLHTNTCRPDSRVQDPQDSPSDPALTQAEPSTHWPCSQFTSFTEPGHHTPSPLPLFSDLPFLPDSRPERGMAVRWERPHHVTTFLWPPRFWLGWAVEHKVFPLSRLAFHPESPKLKGRTQQKLLQVQLLPRLFQELKYFSF